MESKALAVHSILEATENTANCCQDSSHCAVGNSISASKLKLGSAFVKCNVVRMMVVIVSVAAIWSFITLPAVAQSFPGIGVVMTYNVNEGTDFEQVVGTTTLQEFLLGVGGVITQVQGTNPPERMRAVAKQILAAQPELLSIQEVDQWYTGTFNPDTGLSLIHI